MQIAVTVGGHGFVQKCATVAFMLVAILISELCAYAYCAVGNARHRFYAPSIRVLATTFLTAFPARVAGSMLVVLERYEIYVTAFR